MDLESEPQQVTYEVTIWVDEDDPAPTEGEIEEALGREGYTARAVRL